MGGVMVWWFDRTSVFGGCQTGAGARFGWMGGLTGLLFWGDAELAHSAIPLGVFLEFVGRMIYDTSRSESHKQSLFDRWRRQLTNQK